MATSSPTVTQPGTPGGMASVKAFLYRHANWWFWILVLASGIAIVRFRYAFASKTSLASITVLAFLAGCFAILDMPLKDALSTAIKATKENANSVLWTFVLVLSVFWWRYSGNHDTRRTILVIAMSMAAFIIGGLVGFLFSSYGSDEANTIGKLRDWLLAGITTISLVNADKIRAGIDSLITGYEDIRPLVYCMLIVYVGLGFLFMFFQRELILNKIVARARVERVEIEATQQTTSVLQRTIALLPPSLLTGIDDADDLTGDAQKEQAEEVRKLLYSDDVKTFLDQVETSVRTGSACLGWDIVSKVAYVHYYRTYFESDGKALQARKAMNWLSRALLQNPMHADLTMKLADMYAISGSYATGVSILEQLNTRPECPMLAHQWLGYFLLFVPDREADAISHSTQFSTQFGGDANTHLNLARAYGQLFAKYKKQGNQTEMDKAKTSCIAEISRALQISQPMYEYITAKLPKQKNYSFAAIESEADFKKTLDSFKPPANVP